MGITRTLAPAGWALFAACQGKTTDPSCDGAAPFGVEDGFAFEDRVFTWTYDEARDLSVGPAFSFSLADDVVGWAATVDAGAAPTAFAEVRLGDQSYVSVDKPSDFARTARGAAGGRRADTAWDSSDTWVPDSFWPDSAGDSAWDTAYWSERYGWGLAPFYLVPTPASTVALPLAGNLLPKAGCLVVTPAADGALQGEARLRFAARRGTPSAAPLVELHVLVVEGASISQVEIDAVVARMFALYAGEPGAPRLTTARVFPVPAPDGTRVRMAGPALDGLRATVTDATVPNALRVLLVDDFIGGFGTLGFSTGIPGPIATPDTGASAVTLSLDGHRGRDGTLDTDLLGETIAHEVGHQLGLFHTTEAGGDSFDILADTPECPAGRFDSNGDGQVTARECGERDGANFMFWVTAGKKLEQDRISAEQGLVLGHSVAARSDDVMLDAARQGGQ
jgi:hypothetical protein